MIGFALYNRVAGAAAIFSAFVPVDYQAMTREALTFASHRAARTGQSQRDALDCNIHELEQGRRFAEVTGLALFAAAGVTAVVPAVPSSLVLALSVMPWGLLLGAALVVPVLRKRVCPTA